MGFTPFIFSFPLTLDIIIVFSLTIIETAQLYLYLAQECFREKYFVTHYIHYFNLFCKEDNLMKRLKNRYLNYQIFHSIFLAITEMISFIIIVKKFVLYFDLDY